MSRDMTAVLGRIAAICSDMFGPRWSWSVKYRQSVHEVHVEVSRAAHPVMDGIGWYALFDAEIFDVDPPNVWEPLVRAELGRGLHRLEEHGGG